MEKPEEEVTENVEETEKMEVILCQSPRRKSTTRVEMEVQAKQSMDMNPHNEQTPRQECGGK